MHKHIKAIIVIAAITIMMCGCQKNNNSDIESIEKTTPAASAKTMNEKTLESTNYFNDQAQIDQALQKEVEKQYSFNKPLVIVNPYGNSPLTALIIFSTSSKAGGTITVKGKSSEDDITGSFTAAYDHIVPVYGLYSGDTTSVVITLSDGSSSTVEVTTDKVDFSTDGFEVDMKDASAYDYSKLTFICDLNGNISALDSKGDLRWLYSNGGALGVKVLSNGHLAIPSSYTILPMYYKSGISEIDLLGKVYHEYVIPGGMHHDIFEMTNGNLIVASDRTNFDTVEDYVVEIDKETGAIVWELDLTDLIDPTEGGSINRSDTDWFHNNGLWYDEASDNLLISGRHVDAILCVDKSEKTLKWILGDPEGWSKKYQKYFFTPKGTDFEWQYAQHQVSMLANGNIMCFDNGAGRTKDTKETKKVTGKNVYSRAVVYHIDEKDMTIEQVWEYGKELGGAFNSEWVSGAISLNNDPDNIWITSGANLYQPDTDSYDYGPSDMFEDGLIKSTNIVQVYNNKPVYLMKLDFLSYRSLRLSPYEEINAFDVTAQGKYLGNLGITDTVDMDIDLSNAETLKDSTLTLDPVKLTYSANYRIKKDDKLQDSYFILRKTDGTVQVYTAQQSTTDNKDDITVNVSGWVSTNGLSEASYDIYLSLGGIIYNTGYKIDL